MVETTPSIGHLFAVDKRFWGELGPENPVRITPEKVRKVSALVEKELKQDRPIYIIGSFENGRHAIYFTHQNALYQLPHVPFFRIVRIAEKFEITFEPNGEGLSAKIQSEEVEFKFQVFGILKQENGKIKIIADFVPQEGRHPRSTMAKLEAKKLIRLS